MSRRTRVAVAPMAVTSIVLALVAAASAFPNPAAAHENDGEGGPPVFLVHGMPEAVFEVQVGSDRRLKGLRFGQFYNLRAYAGTTLSFAVKLLDSGEPVVATDGFAVPADRSAALVVHHAPDGSGALTSFDNKLDSLESGMSRLVVRHLAAAEAFDVLVDGEVVLAGIEHGWEESIELPAGEVTVTLVAAAGNASDASTVGPVDVSLTPGDRTIVYGFGTVADETLAIVTDVVHGIDVESDDGLPRRAVAASTALALIIGAVGMHRIRRRAAPVRAGVSPG